ncbi:MAG: thioredoxin family protein, partial [Butyricimonas faecihominis]
MKKLLLIYVGIFCSVLAFGQTNFQKLTLDEACTKARAEKKLIFVDLYTSWCAPCKMMADKVFPDVKLGAFMNERFVCVKYDTGADKDGSELAKMFNVQAYPTFLILNVDKGLENQIVGATLEPSDFMNQVEAALKASLASLGQQYENGNRDVSFLTDYLKALLTASMNEKAQEVCVALFKVLPDAEKSNREYW